MPLNSIASLEPLVFDKPYDHEPNGGDVKNYHLETLATYLPPEAQGPRSVVIPAELAAIEIGPFGLGCAQFLENDAGTELECRSERDANADEKSSVLKLDLGYELNPRSLTYPPISEEHYGAFGFNYRNGIFRE